MNIRYKYIITLSLLLLIISNLMAQQDSYTIDGTVTDASNAPIPGVNVFNERNSDGANTDANGVFSLEVNMGDILEFSFLGFETQKITINDSKSIKVMLKENAAKLSEVVVVGYGEKKKSHSIGAVASVDADQIDKIATATADQALLGKLPGVIIKTGSGNSGQPATIQIRGMSSINASNSPLIVVDGYPIQGDMSSINMQDVASINILKDAASASVYGSRAGSGVILITTKKGKVGRVTLEYNVYAGFKTTIKDNLDRSSVNSSLKKYPTLAEWKAYVVGQGGTDLKEIELAETFGVNTDWYDQVYRVGKIMNHQLSASGGTDKLRYFFSVNYIDDEGVMITNEYQKYSFRANIDAKVNKWLELGVNLNPTYSERRDPSRENHALFRTGPWVPLRHNSVTAAITGKNIGDYAHENDFDVGRNPSYTGIKLRAQSDYNPVVMLNDEYINYNRFEGFGNAYLKINIIEGLSLKSSFGGYLNLLENTRYKSSTTGRQGVGETRGYYNTRKKVDWLNENVLTFKKIIGMHSISAIAGLSTQVTQVTNSAVSARSFVVDYIQTVNGGQLSGGSSSKSRSALNSVFARVDYEILDKYLFSFSARSDGSSRFGVNNQYGFFPSASVGWRVSEEEFLKSVPLISNLKLRTSIGSTGNNTIGDYSHIGLLSVNNSILNGNVTSGFAPSSISNPNLGWEKTQEVNYGIDIGIMENRIQLEIDYFNTSTEDLLLAVPLARVTGYASYLDNKGKVENSGFEINLNTINTTGEIKWQTGFNISSYKNKLLDFGGTERLLTTPEPKRPNEFLTQVGSPLVQYYGYKSAGEIPWSAHKTTWPVNANSDFVYAQDLNGDGKIDASDKTVLGDPYPDFTYGFTNTVEYKNFDLAFTIQGSYGAKIFNIDSYYDNSQYVIANKSNLSLTEAEKDRLVVRSQSDSNLQDASYIGFRNATFGYSFPDALIKKYGLSKLRVYFTGTNLLFITASKYTGYNPESSTEATTFTGTNTSNPLVTGYQRGAHPVQRTIAFGVTAKF